MSEFRDVYSKITNKIIADLERGTRPWQKPWAAEHPAGRVSRPLRHNGEAYKGINVLMLWAAAMERGFACPTWLTFKQALDLGGHVKKGETGELVVFASTFRKTEQDDRGVAIDREIPFLKGYTVFNVEQCEGLPERLAPKLAVLTEPAERIAHADAFFAATEADIRNGGTMAYYNEGQDYVQMPAFEAFRDGESHAATLAHELTHWTKHTRRLARDLGREKEGYAKEELVAELGAAFLAADLDITPEPREDHAAYIDSWLRALNNDKRFIFSAATHAQRAVDHLHSLQRAVAETERAAA